MQREPWSKKHKRVTRASAGGMPHSLSNSFAQPLTHSELVELSLSRGDVELVDAYNSHDLTYTPNGGSLDLREEIASLYGPSISADNILVFAGAQVALQTAAIALASDCHTIVFTPGYQSTVEAPSHAGSRVTRIPLKASNGWAIDPKEVRSAIRGDTRYMVINEPYNPAGTLMKKEVQAELVAIAKEQFGALAIEHDAAVHAAGNLAGQAAGHIRLDESCDHIGLWSLRCENEMNADGSCFLGDANNRLLHFLVGEYEVSEFIDDEHDVVESIGDFRLLDFILDIEDLRLLLAGQCVVGGDVSNARFLKEHIALFHLANGPFEAACGAAHVRDDGAGEMWDIRKLAEFDHLGIDEDELHFVGAFHVQPTHDDAVDADAFS